MTEKRKIDKTKFKQAFGTKSMRKGSYSVGSILIFAAILVILNLVVSEIPSKYTKIDVSSQQLYSVGEQTEEAMKNLSDEVTMYLIAESGSEDNTLVEVLEKYNDLSGKIKVEVKDPVVSPGFTAQYTDAAVSDNSVIVVGPNRSKVVNYSDMYVQELNYNTYSYETTGWDGEGQLTSAIAYVTSEELPVVYSLEGHNEMAVSDLHSSLLTSIEKENIQIESLNLLTEEAVPEDADVLMILAPERDLSDEETQKVLDYLEAGGNAFIVGPYYTTDTLEMPNFSALLENYGVRNEDGLVLEGNSYNYYPGYPQYVIPEINSHEATNYLTGDNGYMILPVAHGIETLENYRSSLTIETLLSTTDSAYSKVNLEEVETLEKESGDISGPFALAVAITERYEDVETNIIYVSASTILDETFDNVVSGGNTQFVVGSLSWMTDSEVSVSIPSKSLSYEYLSVTAGSANFWSIITTILLPVGFVLAGGVIWFRRRRA